MPAAGSIEVRAFAMHEAARTAIGHAATFAIVMLATAPIGIWILIRLRSAKVTVTPTGVIASAIFRVRIDFADVARVGICHVPVVGNAAAVSVGQQAMGGAVGVHLCAMTRAGKTKKFAVSMYEDPEALLALVSERIGKPYERLRPTLFGVAWPEA